MRSTLESTLPWWIAGPVLGLVITSLLDPNTFHRMLAAPIPAVPGAEVL